MREIERDEPYQAAGWICDSVLPVLCRRVTSLPWPIFDGLPTIEGAGRQGIAAATAVHPAIANVQSALNAALGSEHELSTIARLATVIVNECKFQRQTDSMREIALTRTVEIAHHAQTLGLHEGAVNSVASWNPLDEKARDFGALSGP